jgi:hypothetical protein
MNPADWDKMRNGVKKAWEAKNGPWPKYTSPRYSKSGNTIKKVGDDWEAHHIIPKASGGPHQAWNVHPVPIPEHMGVIHARTGLLRGVLDIIKGP